jgi:MFS family permease
MERRHAAQVAALTAVHALATAALAIVLASAPTLRRDFQISQTEYGLLVSAFYVGQIGLAIPSGRLVDRIGVRRGLALAMFVSTAALAGLAFASGMRSAALLMFALGVAAAFINPAAAKAVFDWIPIKRRAFAMSIKQMGVPLGAMLAAAGAYIVADLGRVEVFGALTACLAAGAFVLLVFPPDASREPVLDPVHLVDLLGNRALLGVSACNGLFNVAQVGLWVSVAAYGTVLGGGPELGAILFAVLHTGSAAGRLALGLAANRIGHNHLRRLIAVVGAIGTGSLLALAAANDVRTAIPIIALLGMTIGSHPGILQAIAASTVPPQSAAAAIGINMTAVLGGAMAAPLLIGAAVDLGAGFRGAFVLLAAFPAAGCWLLLRRRVARRQGVA